MQNIACLYTNLILLLKKAKKKKTKKKFNFSLFSDDGGGEYSFLALHSRGGLYSISISLSFQCPSLHLMCTSNYGSLLSEQKL